MPVRALPPSLSSLNTRLKATAVLPGVPSALGAAPSVGGVLHVRMSHIRILKGDSGTLQAATCGLLPSAKTNLSA